MRATCVFGFLLAIAAAACSANPTQPTGAPEPPGSSPAPAPPSEPFQPPVPQTARYSVVFQSTWSAATHPTDFPETAHYSGLIGGTHNQSVGFWREGGLATDGIRRMAERGSKSPLDQDVMNAIAAGQAQHLLSGPALDVSPGSISMEFDISQSFPQVTLVTMVAPSPDWFVGVTGLELFRSGQWVDQVRVDLVAYDAGTDSGRSYRSPDQETVPRQPISLLGYPATLTGTAPSFGTFTFSRRN
jgi:hypothetical protein